MDKLNKTGFGSLRGEGKARPLGAPQINPDVSIFKTPNGFVVIYFDSEAKQITEKVDDGNGLVSVLRKAFPSKTE